MKKLKFLSLLLAAVSLFTACSKDDKDDSTESGITMQYDGTTWKSTLATASYSAGSDVTLITGANASSGEQILLSFSGSTTGTLAITDSDGPVISFSMGQSGSFSTLISDNPTGQIVITKFDKEKKLISGTFNFKAEDIDGVEKEFTNGTFTNINYISN